MMEEGTEAAFGNLSMSALGIGAAAAFVSGCIACKWMINLVNKGKLVYFGIYCALVGLVLITYSLI
jgi:undecaprenyl-diphosphatase